MHDITVRRIVGLDLGIATAHTAQVLDETGRVVAKRRVVPTVESFTELERAALAGAPEGVTLELVIEPTGPAWLPVAVWFSGRGHTVFRVSTQKATDLRRFLSRHAKSNPIDAHTLARLPMIDPAGLKPVALPATAQRAQLDRRVRASARLTREIGERKVRIIELSRQVMPTIGPVLSQKLSRADLAVLERYADPRRLATVRRDRLVALVGIDRQVGVLAGVVVAVPGGRAEPVRLGLAGGVPVGCLGDQRRGRALWHHRCGRVRGDRRRDRHRDPAATCRRGGGPMMGGSKVTSGHLRRDACVYVRQSTVMQVREHTESLQRQYELAERAVELGWPSARVVVIDEDLGRSGAETSARIGFQRLVADVGLGQVGLILGIEVSRLARNNADWYQLLDLCAVTDTLIADGDGLYHAGDFNDRLVLGLKGTMSEAELHLIRGRLTAGLRHKAAKGELRQGLPVGYDYDDTDAVVLSAAASGGPSRPPRRAASRSAAAHRRCGAARPPVRPRRSGARSCDPPRPSRRWAVASCRPAATAAGPP
jgi:DNA invertase Pin-like site-specific DNA recombinase